MWPSISMCALRLISALFTVHRPPNLSIRTLVSTRGVFEERPKRKALHRLPPAQINYFAELR